MMDKLYKIKINDTFSSYEFYVVAKSFAKAEEVAKNKPSNWKTGRISRIEHIKEPVLIQEDA